MGTHSELKLLVSSFLLKIIIRYFFSKKSSPHLDMTSAIRNVSTGHTVCDVTVREGSAAAIGTVTCVVTSLSRVECQFVTRRAGQYGTALPLCNTTASNIPTALRNTRSNPQYSLILCSFRALKSLAIYHTTASNFQTDTQYRALVSFQFYQDSLHFFLIKS